MSHGVDFSRRKLVGIAHSGGSTGLMMLQRLHPEIGFLGFILMDPGILPPGRPSSVKLAGLFNKMALTKRATWPSIEEARRELSRKGAYRNFAPTALESFLEFGLRATDDLGAVTLTCSKIQEGAYYASEDMIVPPAETLITLSKEDKLPVHLIVCLKDEYKGMSDEMKAFQIETVGRMKSGSVQIIEKGGHMTLSLKREWDQFKASVTKSTIISYLRRIKYGTLMLESQGAAHEFGEHYILDSDGMPRALTASIKVLDESFWIRLFMHPDFGFAGVLSLLNYFSTKALPIQDAYMLHLIEVDSLTSVFKNQPTIREHSSGVQKQHIVRNHYGDLPYSVQPNYSSSVHYDLPEDLFTGFLSWDLTCAIFDAEAGSHTGDLREERPIAPPRNIADPLGRQIPPDDLERGQMAKLHLIAKKARIGKGSRVLDIGGGWGSFSILAAKEYGAIVDTLTISESQKAAADSIIAAHGLSSQITVHLMDYRDMPPHFENAFDAVISIGVTEHIGFEFLNGWFKKIAWAMKPQNSFKVFTMSTVPDTRWKQFRGEVDFFRKYIYPGAALSSPRTLVNAITDAGLNIVSIDDISPHYTRTAREWGYRFGRNFDSHIKPALQRHDPQITEEGLEIFRRKWTYYFAYIEGGFALRCIYDQLFVTSREVCVLYSTLFADEWPYENDHFQHNVLGYSD
ncbi:hypothetical protein H0H87_007338 [Tephrocybe sp. NHM501043]|nr:hypothetical protein H0H87_007338 [Tephrocybe sp. NHM501043]